MLNVGYKPASEDIVFEEFEGELVVLNLSSGQYFGFNQSAATLWTALDAGCRAIDLASSNLDQPDVSEFVQKLISFGLIVPDETAKSVLDEATKSELEKIASKPTVEMYEDLADLIVADPIHDVDAEEGWPIKSAAN